jgi:two-component system chemotaxis response regulator CheY
MNFRKRSDASYARQAGSIEMLATTCDRDPTESDAEGSLLILVVDDTPSYRAVLELALAAPGREIVGVDNVADALELVRARRFALVIGDYAMPGGTGIDLLRQIRRADGIQPFVLMSSELPAEAARVAALGNAYVVEKKGGIAELTALLEAIEL